MFVYNFQEKLFFIKYIGGSYERKIKSRKFWIAVLSDIVSITVVFTEIGGTIGTIAGIIGTLAASISYMITECRVDVARAKVTYDEVSELIKLLKKKEGE